MILTRFTEPGDECWEVELGPVSVGAFVEASRNGGELLEPVEAAFDDVASLVELTVEGRRSAAGPAVPHPIGLLVRSFGDHRPDALTSHRLVDHLRRIRLAGDDRVRSATRSPDAARGTCTASRTASKAVESLTLSGVTRTARGAPVRRRRGGPWWSARRRTGRAPDQPPHVPDLPVRPTPTPLFAGAGGVLVSPVDRGVDRNRPLHRLDGVVADLGLLKQAGQVPSASQQANRS